jgi:hypothetical protein
MFNDQHHSAEHGFFYSSSHFPVLVIPTLGGIYGIEGSSLVPRDDKLKDEELAELKSSGVHR